MACTPRGLASRESIACADVTFVATRIHDINHSGLLVSCTKPPLSSRAIVIARFGYTLWMLTRSSNDADHPRRGMTLTSLGTLSWKRIGRCNTTSVMLAELLEEIRHLGLCMGLTSRGRSNSEIRTLGTSRIGTLPNTNVDHSFQFMSGTKPPEGLSFIVASSMGCTPLGLTCVSITHPEKLVFCAVPRGSPFDRVISPLLTHRVDAPLVSNIKHTLFCMLLAKPTLSSKSIKVP